MEVRLLVKRQRLRRPESHTVVVSGCDMKAVVPERQIRVVRHPPGTGFDPVLVKSLPSGI